MRVCAEVPRSNYQAFGQIPDGQRSSMIQRAQRARIALLQAATQWRQDASASRSDFEVPASRSTRRAPLDSRPVTLHVALFKLANATLPWYAL